MENPAFLDEARALVRSWLTQKVDAPSQGTPAEDTALLERFLTIVAGHGFALEVVTVGTPESPAWVGYWTYHRSSFEGFRQPADQPDPVRARLLACAALLRNDWCRARLP